MRVYLDTEFKENGTTIRLISIGMVREDGQTYYAEMPNGRALAREDEWLSANVLPTLLGGEAVKPRAQVASEIIEFVGESPEFWAYYADYDWVVLCQLYGRMIDLPQGWPMFCRDLKQASLDEGFDLPIQEGVEHNALADARWVASAHHALLHMHDECTSERYSWDFFSTEAVDAYWMRCHRVGLHDEHENSETGAKWTGQ